MTNLKYQMEPDQYNFSKYVNHWRWSSIQNQLNETFMLPVKNVLEIGYGTGIYGSILKHYGLNYTSLDYDARLGPDYVSSVTSMPFNDNSFDAVVCFQVLEHLPYKDFENALREIRRVSSKFVIISLPDARRMITLRFHISRFGTLRFSFQIPKIISAKHSFDGQHYWEINKRGFELKVIEKAIEDSGITINKTYRSFEVPYHRFFICDID